jgi:hypothetical protein
MAYYLLCYIIVRCGVAIVSHASVTVDRGDGAGLKIDRRPLLGEQPLNVYLALKESGNHLTTGDLLRILRTTERVDPACGKVHISLDLWLVLVEVSEMYYRKVAEALQNISYECNVFSGEFNKLSTFILLSKGGKRDGT